MADSLTRPMTMPDLVNQRAVRNPAQVALVVDGVRSLTIGDWSRRSHAVAHELLAQGIGPADRVGLLFDDAGWIEYAVGNLAIYLAGGTAVGLSTRLGVDELRHRLDQCDVAGVLHSSRVEPPAFAGWAATVESLERGRAEALEVRVEPEDLAEILYTSGTTGRPKAVAVPHGNLTYGRDGRGDLFGGVDSILCAVPLATNAGHSAMMVALMTGSAAHVLSDLAPETIARAIERFRVQLAILPPPIATRLVATGLHRTHDLSSLTTLMLGSAGVPAAIVHELSRTLPDVTMLIGYGSTEYAPGFVSLPTRSWAELDDPDHYRRQRQAVLGRPGGDTELRIVDESGAELPAGELGEICLRSAAPPRSYYRDPEATARVFEDGWVRMGDLGHLDEDGTLYFFDRVRDVITSDGQRISSQRAEGALYWHPDVVEAAVFGLPDPGTGQIVAAAVELRNPVTEQELREFLADRLAPAEIPTRFFVVDELPRGTIGKVRKRELRERFAAATAGRGQSSSTTETTR